MPAPSPKLYPPDVCAWLASKYVYDPDTGRIVVAATGELADTRLSGNGYRMVRVTNTRLSVRAYISAHRLAWFLANGSFPEVEIDHVNHVKTDNSLANLRVATRQENHRNGLKKVSRRGQAFTSQYKGVHWSKKDRRWLAQISVGGRTRHIGSFRHEGDAAKAYDAAARELFAEFAHVNLDGTT